MIKLLNKQPAYQNNIYRLLFILFLAFISLGQLLRLQLTSGVAIYPHDLVIVAWLLLSVFTHSTSYRQLLKKFKLNKFKLEIITILWIGLGLVRYYFFANLQTESTISPLLYLGRLLAYLLFALSLKIIKPFSLRQIKLGFIASGLFILTNGLLQYFFLPDTRFLAILGWDEHYYRLISTQLDPGFTGILLVITFIYLQSIKIDLRYSKIEKLFWPKKLLSILLGVGVLLTYSRASFLSFISALLLLIFMNYKKHRGQAKWLLYLLIAFIISINFLPRPAGEGVRLERSASITARLTTNRNVIDSMRRVDWIIGKGLFVSRPAPANSKDTAGANILNTAHFPDNLVIFILTSLGLPGLLLVFAVLWKWGRRLLKNNYFALTALLVVLLHSMFNHTLLQPFVLLFLLPLLLI